MLLQKNGEKGPEEMKRPSQNRNYAQLWMCLVVKVKSDAVKNIAQEIRSMNQGTLDLVKQEMARVKINILEISQLNGLAWVNLTQMTIISTTVGKNP